MIAGLTKRSGDRAGFVKSVSVSISLKAFGQVNDQATLGEVTRHEMGHVLGLSHANFDDLMDPTVGGESAIRGCDIEGVIQANQWKLVVNDPSPSLPSYDQVICNEDGTFNSVPVP